MARILGIDHGKHTVRGAVVRTALRRGEVVQYLEAPLVVPDDVDPDATPEQRLAKARRQAVGALVDQLDPAPDQVIVALDGRDASLRTVEIPFAAQKRAHEVLPFELEPLLPFEAEDAVLDHQPVERDGPTLRLLAAAVRKDKVSDLLAELGEVDVDPKEVAVGGASLDGLARLVPELSEGTVLVLAMSAERGDLCLLRDGRAAFARTVAIRDDVPLRDGSRFEAELRRSLASYRATGGTMPDRAFLTGDLPALNDADPPEPDRTPTDGDAPAGDASLSASDPPPPSGDADPVSSSAPPPAVHRDDDDAAAWVEAVTGLDTVRVPLPLVPGTDPATRSRFGGAVALAARGLDRDKRIDLRRGEFAYTRTVGAVQRYLRLAAVGAAAVLTAFAFATFAKYRTLADERDVLVAELGRVTEESFGQGTESATRARELLDRGTRTADPLPDVDAIDFLEYVSEHIDTEIPHTSRTFLVELGDEGGEGRFELAGSVASIAERDQIASAMESHACLRDLDRGSTSAAPGGDGRLRYQLEADVRCGEDDDDEDSGRRRGRRSRSGRR